jgi:hypothetical protein
MTFATRVSPRLIVVTMSDLSWAIWSSLTCRWASSTVR